MDVITLDKTWSVTQYPVDYSVYTTLLERGRYQVLSVKKALVDAGWSVTYSCDKTNYGGSDYWLSTASIFNAAAGAAHSWVVLTNSNFMANFAICLDCTPASQYSSSITVVVAPDGFNANGTTLNRPTAVNRSYTWDTADMFTAGGSTNLGSTVKCFYSSDSESFRVVVSFGGCCGEGITNYAGSFLCIEKPKQPSTWWSSPVVVWCAAKATRGLLIGGLSFANISNVTQNNIITWMGNDLVQLRIGSLGVNGEWITRSSSCGYGITYEGGNIFPPLYYISETSSYPGVFGSPYDMYAVCINHQTMTRYSTTSNSRGLVKIGCVVMGCPYGYLCP